MDNSKRSHRGLFAAVGAGLGLVVGTACGVALPEHDTGATPVAAPPAITAPAAPTYAPPAITAPAAPTYAPPADVAPVGGEAVDDTMTASQENAVSSAESYLRFAGFSRDGLIEQLEYEGFSKADAKFAVDHVDVDWNEQAAKKAKSYMDFSSFSRSGLIDQLEYEGFTSEQASHGADSVGL